MGPLRIQGLCAALIWAGCVGCSDSNGERRHPDVVLIVADTLRNDHLSSYGYSRPTSPGLAAFGERGVVFEDVTAQWPWTLPSMVSLFQGQYLTRYRDSLDPATMTIPEAFKQAGYHTLGVVANCLVDEDHGFARGFDEFTAVDCWEDEELKIPSVRDIEKLAELLLEDSRRALTLDSSGHRAPLFLYIHAFDTHDEYLPHDELNSVLPLDGAPPVQPKGYWMDTIRERGGWNEAPPNGRKNWELSMRRMQAMRARYDQEVLFLDTGISIIIGALQQQGLGKNAIFAFVSDHGEGLWEHVSNETEERLRKYAPHQFFYKTHGGNGYQNTSATPFQLWGGDLPQGLRCDQPVENVDLYPTLLELADIAPPPGLDGRSLVDLWDSNADDWRTHVFACGSHTITVRDVRSHMKLILPIGKSTLNGRGLELYDLHADPGERVNLVQARPDTVRALVRAHLDWVKRNPTETTMDDYTSQVKKGLDDALAKKLRALGYTEADTGIGGLDGPPARDE